MKRPDLAAIRERSLGPQPKKKDLEEERRKLIDEALYSIPNLIEALQKLYPDTIQSIKPEPYLIGIAQGRQHVINTVTSWLIEQQDNKEL